MTEDLVVRIGARAEATASTSASATGKRAAIVRAATELFLAQGYQATSTEQIAAGAAVSKQTVYNQFGDKQSLFHDIVLGVTATAEEFADRRVPEAFAAITSATDLVPALEEFARGYRAIASAPHVLALRRLVIAEAVRFPDLARTYHRRAPARVLTALAEQFARLDARGLLAVPDPGRAADDFAYLLVGRVLDRGLFGVGGDAAADDDDATEPTGAAADHDAAARHAVAVFLAAYRAPAP